MSLLSETELRRALGVPAKRLRKWIRRGLPSSGRGKNRRFDEAAVAAWLTEHGLAQPAPPAETIATTREEASRLLRVNLRTLAGWLTEPGFPGKAGEPGRRNGHFPIERIEQWRAARFAHTSAAGGDSETTQLRQKKLGFEVDEAQLDLEVKLGTLLDKEQTAQLVERVIATAKAQLEEFPDRLEARLPAKAPARFRRRLRRDAAKLVRQVLRTLAELVAGDTDAAEESGVTNQEPSEP